MAKKNSSNPKPVEQYEHKDKERFNIPPVGLVTEKTDTDYGQKKKKYKYDPHLDPELTWDAQKSRDEALEAFEKLKAGIKEHEKSITEIKDKFGSDANDIVKKLQAQHHDMLQMLKEAEAIHQPNLKWTGKAEHTSFEVPTVSLHVHERIDPKTIIETVKKPDAKHEQLSMFEQDKKPFREAIEFYKHKEGWTNRFICGDSLLVMNSLLEKEGMGGKVQMVYFDPPYGISYSSNFQPFVNNRNVTDGKDEDLTQEPEMIKAFRDTWELGIHSYLTYLRDRLLLAKELLHESGSIFVQISDENVHHVREILDEIFGSSNFISLITFRKKTAPLGTKLLENTCDYMLFYSKNKNKIQFKQLYKPMVTEGDSHWNIAEFKNGDRRPMTREEINNYSLIHEEFTPCQLITFNPIGYDKNRVFPILINGKEYRPPKGKSWKAGKTGIEKLLKDNRLMPYSTGNTLRYVSKASDYPVIPTTALWNDTSAPTGMNYVVETSVKPLKRCILMTTSPGDLILDITCGSGATANVAEEWGRRWITCDTSRVAITLSKQRLMTANYNYYKIARPEEGISGGFKYKTVPHITLKSIANDQRPKEEILYDQPLIDNKKTRVTGPFTVESIPAPFVKDLDDVVESQIEADTSVARKGETLRQDQWREELLRAGVRAKGGAIIEFSRVDAQPGTKYIQAVAETKGDNPEKVMVVFGPEHAPLEQRIVAFAIDEAQYLKPDILLFCAFQFDDEAAKDIDETPEDLMGFKLLKAHMNMDIQTDDLKKKRSTNQSFWLIGQPDVRLHEVIEGEDKNKVQVEVMGFDYFNPKTGNLKSEGKDKIAMWMLDPDYDGRSLFPKQVFFPMAGAKEGWGKLAKTLKAEIDQEKIEAFKGSKSLPFEPGKQIAVKIVDDRGIESLKIIKR